MIPTLPTKSQLLDFSGTRPRQRAGCIPTRNGEYNQSSVVWTAAAAAAESVSKVIRSSGHCRQRQMVLLLAAHQHDPDVSNHLTHMRRKGAIIIHLQPRYGIPTFGTILWITSVLNWIFSRLHWDLFLFEQKFAVQTPRPPRFVD